MIENSSETPSPSAGISVYDEQSSAADALGYRDAPTVSVCMPVYNCERYVAEAVESVLAQTFRDFDFLIIDDGSTDGSLRILERYAALDPRIRLISRLNQGLVASLNELVNLAKGEFLARMDADDIAMPERFEKQVDYLRTHPECAVVGSRVWDTDADGDPVAEYPTLSDHEEIDAFHFQMKGPALIHPSIMMRRAAVLAIGGYRNFVLSEEVDLYLRLAERWRLARVPDYLLKYRIHTANYSRSPQTREWSYRVNSEILTEAYQRRNLPVTLPPPEALPVVPTPPAVELFRLRGWWSLLSGHQRTARKYARRLLLKRPFARESWRLMYCALRGY
jgi:glycosyltransferase involved in cell wall biosynthesis